MAMKSSPWFLSKILDIRFVGSKEVVDVRRKSIILEDFINSGKRKKYFTAGSIGDGFIGLCSDTDMMVTSNEISAMYPNSYQEMITYCNNKTILFIRKLDCGPGFVALEIGHKNRMLDNPDFENAIVPVLKSLFLSSDIYREGMLGLPYLIGVSVFSKGPSNKVDLGNGCTADRVKSFSCFNWPHEAYEWVSRVRVFGWPTKTMVRKIVNEGCYFVPIGDKCSGNTPLQWRISFVTAERYLVHSLNHIQFKVYGLMKYLLTQIKSRIEQDTGEDDILCSYFMKTLIFYAVENSPQSLWQEKKIFFCFQFCLTMLLDWVHACYCPNYFIKTNNMFKRKINGVNRMKLLNILCELLDMKWLALSVGSAYNPSIWEFLQYFGQEAIPEHFLTPTESEYNQDHNMNHCLQAMDFGYMDLFLGIRKAMIMLSKAETESDEVLAYSTLVTLLCTISIQFYQKSKGVGGNKGMYKVLRKCKHWMSLSLGTEKLYLATFYYHVGNFIKAVELCRNSTSSVCLFEDGEYTTARYKDTYCGKGYPLINKLQQAHAKLIHFHTNVLQFCLPHLHKEVLSQYPHRLRIPPQAYAKFLSFMCHHSIDDAVKCEETIYDLEAIKYEENHGGEKNWIVHSLIGICYQKKGDYYNAIRSYQDSLRVESKENPARERIPDLMAITKLYV